MTTDSARLAKLVHLRAVHARMAELEIRELVVRERIRALDWQVTRAERRLARVDVVPAEREAHLAAAALLGEARREQLNFVARRRRLDAMVRGMTRELVRGTEA